MPLPDVVQTIPWWHDPSVWFWLLLPIVLGVLEWWAWRTKHRTPSQKTQGWSRVHRWFRVLGTAVFLFLSWHLFWERIA